MEQLRIAIVYNRYLARGGEDEVFEAEADLLERHGCWVERVVAVTKQPRGLRDRIALGVGTVWSLPWYRRFQRILGTGELDLVHVHNSFPVMSPSILHACREARIPVVHTLHNYRLICPSATLFRDGDICEDCLGRAPLPGIRHRCYHGSALQTAAIAGMLSFHRALRTWSDAVDVYVALSEFSRRKFIEAGIPSAQIVVKPNFVHPDPGVGRGRGECALFVGKLTAEKGVRTLLKAWRGMSVPLRIVGEGPLAREVRTRISAQATSPVEFVGAKSREEVFKELRNARILVFPSESYESFPLILIEAFACGLPVIAARRGAGEEIIEHERTGMHFTAGDAVDLAQTVRHVWRDTHLLEKMGLEARREYESKYTAERNFEQLMAVYASVIARRRKSDGPGHRPVRASSP